MGSDIYLSVVIPAYNEAGSIADTLHAVTEHLSGRFTTWELIVVDDGSVDATAEIVRRMTADGSRIRLLQNERNQGKGASVRRGVLEARGQYIFFMDADLSVPIEEIDDALELMVNRNLPILIGSRRVKGARIETRQPRIRQYLGQSFTYLARLILCPRIADFTCGFKGFRRNEARLLFSAQQCDDWAFDAEVLYLARLLDQPVYQHPVLWRHRSNSKVRLPRDIWRSLSALVRIRLRAPAQALRQIA